MPSTPTSVVLAMPSGLIRDSIRAALSQTENMRVVGEAENIQEMHELLSAQEPNILILGTGLVSDNRLPRGKDSNAPIKVVLIAPGDSPPLRLSELFSLGARAVVTSNLRVADLTKVLQLVSQDFFVAREWAPTADRSGALARGAQRCPGLSARERELLQLLAEGLSEKQASERLGIGRRTVQTHIGRIKTKVGATTRTHAVALAVAEGLVSPYWGVDPGAASRA